MPDPLISILETTSFSPVSLDRLQQAGWRVHMETGVMPQAPETRTQVQGLIIRFGQRWTPEVLDHFPNLRFLGVPATGTDHLDLEAFNARGIQVHSLLGLPGLDRITATPELAFGLLLSLLRKLPAAYQSVLESQWDRDRFFGRQLAGKKLGVIGLGRTGSAFAKRAEAFDMDVHYVDPFVTGSQYTRHSSLTSLAETCDVFSLHVVLKPETRHLLDRTFFEALTPDSWLINTSRGDLIEEEALLAALRSGRLTGAAVDVIQNEPEKHSTLRSPLVAYAQEHDHLLITPHIGGATRESIHQAEDILIEDILRHHQP